VECPFSVEIHAPLGLAGLEQAMAPCSLPLVLYASGFNGKVILRPSRESDLDWSMDPSTGDLLFASGVIAGSPSEAESQLRSLSVCLRVAGFPHRILIDGPNGALCATLEHSWPPNEAL
jgi:hypothetical protein